jgi:release factor glutamine methyltransferase
VRTVTIPGVFRPRSDAWLLADVMRALGVARHASVLDLFTGSGVLAVAAALEGAKSVTAVDISRRAVLNTRLNAWLNRISMRIARGDLFQPVAGQSFDLILANPPYVPSEKDRLPTRGAPRAWEGGFGGRRLLDRLFSEAADHLNADGSLLAVQSSISGEEASLAALSDGGLDPEVVARRRGPLGPIVSGRARSLEAQGVLRQGQDEEELLVLRGTRRPPRRPDSSGRPSPPR